MPRETAAVTPSSMPICLNPAGPQGDAEARPAQALACRVPAFSRYFGGIRGLALVLKLAFQQFDLVGQRGILGHQRLDLAHRVEHRGVVATSEAAADLGQGSQR